MMHPKGVDPEKLDIYMQHSGNADDGDLLWHAAHEAPFQLNGFAWFEQERLYRRLPVQSSQPIRREVDELANCTTGGQIHFQTDSPSVSIKASLSGRPNMYHMPTTGQCGFDCYISKPGGELYYISTTRLAVTDKHIHFTFYHFPDEIPQMREVIINFPLYQGVKEVSIGLKKGSSIEAPASNMNTCKVIIYGTSITQGGCASRPGMLPSNIWSRRLKAEFFNLGFSGNGQGEPELASLISEIKSPALLIIDYAGNARSPELYKATLPEFVGIYRSRHPEVPILILSRIRYAADRYNLKSSEDRHQYHQISEDFVAKQRTAGDRYIHFHSCENILGEDYDECTVDGKHPSDLGFMRIADGLTPILKKLLSERN